MDKEKPDHVYAVYRGVFGSIQELYREKEDAEKVADTLRAFGIKVYVKKKEVR